MHVGLRKYESVDDKEKSEKRMQHEGTPIPSNKKSSRKTIEYDHDDLIGFKQEMNPKTLFS